MDCDWCHGWHAEGWNEKYKVFICHFCLVGIELREENGEVPR